MGLLDQASIDKMNAWAMGIPGRAKAMYQGLLNAPAEIKQLFDPQFQKGLLATARYGIDRDKALALAMDVMPGGIAGTFIGKGAKTWDAAANAKALQMAQEKVDPRTIWKETGNWKAPDGMWRQEIPDNLSQMTDLPVNQSWEDFARLKEREVYGRRGAPLSSMSKREFKEFKEKRAEWENLYNKTNASHRPVGNIMQHDALYEAYPDLRSLDAFLDSTMGKSGSFGRNQISFGDVSNPEGVRGLFGHELQHAIQQREGWAIGGSPEMAWKPDAGGMKKEFLERDAAKLAVKYRDSSYLFSKKPGEQLLADPEFQAIQRKLKSIEIQNDPMQAYNHLAGEAEARATQARMNMDMAQRLNTFPEDSYDVPINQLIIRGMLGQ